MPAKKKDDDEKPGLLDTLMGSSHAPNDKPKKPAADPKPEPVPAEEPEHVSETGRSPEPLPDAGDIVMNYDARGDAHSMPADAGLAPESQQPGEKYEDWMARTGGRKPEPGVFDATVTRGEEPK